MIFDEYDTIYYILYHKFHFILIINIKDKIEKIIITIIDLFLFIQFFIVILINENTFYFIVFYIYIMNGD